MQDPLAPARGIIIGVACGIGFWALCVLAAIIVSVIS